MTIAFGVLSVYGGRLSDRMDKRILIIIGGFGMIAATLIFANLTVQSPLWLILTMLAFAGVGFGLAFPALNMAMMSCVKDDELNAASGTFTMFGCIGNTIGLILSAMSIVYFGKNTLFTLIKQSSIPLSNVQHNALIQLIGSAHYPENLLHLFSNKELPAILNTLQTAFTHAMSQSISIATILAVLSVVFGFFMIKK